MSVFLGLPRRISADGIGLIVEGTLRFESPTGDTIAGNTDSPTPEKGQWYGLHYAGAAREPEPLHGLTIEWRLNEITASANSGFPDLSDVSIRPMYGDGIYGDGLIFEPGAWRVRHLRTRRIEGNGVYLEPSSAHAGVLAASHSSASGSVVLHNGVFKSRALHQDVVRFRYMNSITPITADIFKPKKNRYSVNLYGANANLTCLIGNTEIDGGQNGVHLSAGRGTIRRTTIRNAACGVRVPRSGSSGVVTHEIETSRITDNSYRVYAGSGTGALLRDNDLHYNSTCAIYHTSPQDFDAQGNYWGKDVRSEIISKGCDGNIGKIYDKRDSSSYGVVGFCPFADSAYGTQATIELAVQSAGGAIEFRCDPKAGLSYDLIRGDVSNVAFSGLTVDLGTVSRNAETNDTGLIVDQSPAPAPGAAWFFLLRDSDAPGTYERSSGHQAEGEENTRRRRAYRLEGDCS